MNQDNKIYVTVQDHPFKPFKGLDFKEGVSLQEIVNKIFPASSLHDRVEVFINDVECKNWNVIPLGADNVHLKFIQGDPGTAFLGLTVVQWAVMGTIVVGTYFWAKSMMPEISGLPGRANQITGANNQPALYQPISVILGRRRVVPPLAARPYSEIVGDDQYYRILYGIGYGPLKLEDFKIGETPLDEFAQGDFKSSEGIVSVVEKGQIVRKVETNKYYESRNRRTSINLETENYLNTANWYERTDLIHMQVLDHYENFAPITLFPNIVSQENINVELPFKDGNVSPEWVIRTTNDDITEIGIDFVFPSGLYHNTSKGDKIGARGAIQIEIQKDGDTDWYTPVFFDVFNAPPLEESIRVRVAGTNSLSMSAGRPWFIGGYQTFSTGYVNEGGIARKDNGDILYNATYWPNPPTIPITPVDVLSRSSNLSLIKTNGNPLQSIYVDRNEASGFNVGTTFPVEKGKYNVRVRRLRPVGRDRDTNNITWAALKGFKNEPPVKHGGIVLVALRIKATDQIRGSIDNFNCIATSCVPNWDTENNWDQLTYGGVPVITATDPVDYAIAKSKMFNKDFISSVDLIPTQDPAWLMRWIMQGPFNKNRLSDNRIDMSALEDFSEWCRTEEFTCNAEIDYDSTVFKELSNVASTGRARFLFKDGLYSVVIDRDIAAPSQIFSDKNAMEIRSERTFDGNIPGYLVKYQNQDKDFIQDEFAVYREDGAPSVDDRLSNIELWGVTNYSQAYRMGRFRLAERILRRENFAISADIENLRCRVGDWVKVQSKVLLIGQTSGRVTSVLNDRIVVDESCVFEAGKSYGIDVRDKNFTIRHYTPTNLPGETNTLLISSTSNIKVGDLFTFGESTKETLDLRVLSIEHKDDLKADILCDSLAKPIFSIDESPIPPFDSGITNPPSVFRLPKPFISYVNTISQRYRDERGAVVATVEIGFTTPVSDQIIGARVEAIYRSNTGVVIESGSVEVTARKIILENILDGTYDFGIRLVKGSAVSEYVYYNYTVSGFDGSKPDVPNVTGLELIDPTNEEGTEFAGKEAKFRWRKSSNFRTFEVGSEPDGANDGALDNFFEDYLVNILDVSGRLIRSENVKDNFYTYSYEKNVFDGGPRRSFTIEVIARGSENQVSKSPARLSVSNPPPELPSNLRLLPDLKALEVRFDRPTDIDYSHIEIYISDVSGQNTLNSNLVYEGPNTEIRLTKTADDEPLIGGMNYYVTLRPADAFGSIGAPIVELSQRVQLFGLGDVDLTPPDKVENVTGHSSITVSELWTLAQINLTWDSVDNIGIQNYIVEYNVQGESEVASISTSIPEAIIIPAEINKIYEIKVAAVSIFGVRGNNSNTLLLTVEGDTVPPQLPTNVKIINGLDKVSVSWDNPPDADWLQTELFRGTSLGFIPSASNKVYTGRGDYVVDDNVVFGTEYFYKLRTSDVSKNYSEYSLGYGPGTPERITSVNIEQYIQDAAIATSQIIPGAITADVLSPEVIQEIDNIGSNLQNVSDLVVLEGGRVTYSSNAPTSSDATGKPAGATWWRRNSSGQIIGQWELVSGSWVSRTLNNSVIANIDAGKINTGFLSSDRIQVKSITGPKLADGSIGTIQIGDSAITSAKIGNAEIKSANIADLAVGNSHIANAAINDAKIANLAVSSAKIANAAIVEAKIGNLAVTTSKINDLAVTNAKIGNLDAVKITTGTLNAARIGANTITANKLNITELSAITANVGTLTSGIIQGPIIRTGTTNARVEISLAGIRGTNASNIQSFNISSNGSGGIGIARNKDGSLISGTQAISWDTSGNIKLTGNISGSGDVTFPMFTADFPSNSPSNLWRVRVGNHIIGSRAYQMSFANLSTNEVRFGMWTDLSTGKSNAVFSGEITASAFYTSDTNPRLELESSLQAPGSKGVLRSRDANGNIIVRIAGNGDGHIGKLLPGDKRPISWLADGTLEINGTNITGGKIQSATSGHRILIEGSNFKSIDGTNLTMFESGIISQPDYDNVIRIVCAKSGYEFNTNTGANSLNPSGQSATGIHVTSYNGAGVLAKTWSGIAVNGIAYATSGLGSNSGVTGVSRNQNYGSGVSGTGYYGGVFNASFSDRGSNLLLTPRSFSSSPNWTAQRGALVAVTIGSETQLYFNRTGTSGGWHRIA